MVVSFGVNSLLRKGKKIVIAVWKLSGNSWVFSSSLNEIELDYDERLGLEFPEDFEVLSFPVVERELARLQSVSKLIGLICLWMNSSMAPFGDFTSDALDFSMPSLGRRGLS